METASTKLRKSSRCAFVALQNSVAFVRREDGEDMHTIWMQNSLCEAEKAVDVCWVVLPHFLGPFSLPDQRDEHHGPRRAPHRCCLPMVTVALSTSPPMTLAYSCGNLRSRLPRAAPFFWKGGTPHCSQQPSTHAPSQFTFGIWKDGRTGIRRSRRQCSSDSKYRTGLKDMI